MEKMESTGKKGKANNTMFCLLFVWYVFFSYFKQFNYVGYSAIWQLALVAFIPIIFFVNRKFVIKCDSISIPWIIFFVIYAFGVVFLDDIAYGFAWVIQKFLLLFVLLYLQYQPNRIVELIGMLTISSMIHVAATLVEYIAPGFISSIRNVIVDSEIIKNLEFLHKIGYHCGISQQASYNAFYISVTITILFPKVMLSETNRLRNSLLLLLAFLALLLTGKRGILVAIVAATGFMLIFLNRIDNRYASNKFKSFGIIGIVLVVVIYIFLNTSVASNISRRFGYTGDLFMAGRNDIWEIAIKGIREHPIIGNGTSSFNYSNEVSTHNCFLQMWYENGILGLITLITLFGTTLFGQIKKAKEETNPKLLPINCSAVFFTVFFIISCLTDSYFFHNKLVIVFILFSAVPYLKSNINE